MTEFYRVAGVPVHDVLLLTDREAATNFPVGNVVLAYCRFCEFIGNIAFDPTLQQYGSGYEGTQAYSATFDSFHRKLAEQLVETYGLRHRDILEIGCGQGEFLNLLCQIGENRGVGFDPAYDSERMDFEPSKGATFIADFYSEEYASYRADFVCCKQTLEHIHNTAEFVGMVRRSIGEQADTRVFFQVPDVTRILTEQAFWDIFYEHCSYFCAASLVHVFQRSGFDVIESRTEYDDQYLMIEAQPGLGSSSRNEVAGTNSIAGEVAYFAEHCQTRIEAWKRAVSDMCRAGRRTILWGGGSKAVSFLTTLKLTQEIDYVVDINPHKHGTFLPGTGHEVVGPDFLQDRRPDVVVIMNPIYTEEIRRQLDGLGIHPEFMPITCFA
jgi:SAM-dependent methyltransferase